MGERFNRELMNAKFIPNPNSPAQRKKMMKELWEMKVRGGIKAQAERDAKAKEEAELAKQAEKERIEAERKATLAWARRTFNQDGTLKAELRPDTATFVCPICQRDNFKSKMSLAGHQKAHGGKGEVKV